MPRSAAVMTISLNCATRREPVRVRSGVLIWVIFEGLLSPWLRWNISNAITLRPFGSRSQVGLRKIFCQGEYGGHNQQSQDDRPAGGPLLALPLSAPVQVGTHLGPAPDVGL